MNVFIINLFGPPDEPVKTGLTEEGPAPKNPPDEPVKTGLTEEGPTPVAVKGPPDEPVKTSRLPKSGPKPAAKD